MTATLHNNMQATKSIMTGTQKTQFYFGNGTGRDTYIYNNNGGFCPTSEPVRIEELGTFYFLRQRPRDFVPTIHSKGVAYINNGGGRDTYISNNAGGLRSLHRPAMFSKTFYNSLRQYPDSHYNAKKGRSHTMTMREK